jgi:gamma-glutamylaminecyclotransferase
VSDERTYLLFVYGTLLSGEPAHALLDGARSLGPAKTPPAFDLVDLGPHPALVAGGTTIVVGELYEVSVAALAAIDIHEEHPVLFKRRTLTLADGREAHAYTLDVDQVRGRRRIRSGDWRGRFRPPPAPSARDSAFVRWSKNRHR